MTIHASFNKNIEDSLQKYWSLPSMSDYELHTLQYSDVAEDIAKLHILFEKCNICKGDKIALCSRNMSRWGVVFLATLTYGAVAVPILHEFHPEQIHHIINHSESKLLFVGDLVWKKLSVDEMPELKGIMQINDLSLLHSRSKEFKETAENLNKCFGEKYPSSFGKANIKYHEDSPEELAIINYTSGTTSNSKGVMIPYRAIVGNIMCADELIGEHVKPGDKLLSMLPLAHTLGMSFEFIYEFVSGIHVHFLTKVPTPSILLKALADIRPVALVCVPLIIEKVVRKAIMQKISDPKIKLLLKTPIIGKNIKKKICEGLRNAFGGNFCEVVIGGAALNQEVEALLHDIGFNFTVGYGATECAPLISCADWRKFVPGSCGKIVNRMEVKIDSRNPYDVPGEILVKGQNVMLGYYKNPEATVQTLVDGWYHTGDLGVIDRYGNIFIKGRIKNMLLSGNGQNIYPEEIEDILNNLPYVQECLVVQREDKLYGLVYPDPELIKKNRITHSDLEKKMEENRKILNSQLPQYEQIVGIILQREEFEKTPKRSIKRFLYT